MVEFETTIFELKNSKGLHARAAAKFVKTCEKYMAEVTVIKGEVEVSALSIMGLMMLAARHGTEISVKASGPDAKEVLNALSQLIEDRFGED